MGNLQDNTNVAMEILIVHVQEADRIFMWAKFEWP